MRVSFWWGRLAYHRRQPRHLPLWNFDLLSEQSACLELLQCPVRRQSPRHSEVLWHHSFGQPQVGRSDSLLCGWLCFLISSQQQRWRPSTWEMGLSSRTYNHSAPYSFSILSPIGFSARTRPSSYLLKVKPSTEYACACFNAGTRSRCLTIRQAFGGIWIPAPIVRISGARSTTVTSSGGLDLRQAIAQARPPIPAPTTTMWSG